MHDSFWSMLPFLIVIPLSIWTRQVLPGLTVGLLIGAYMLHPSLLGGIDATLSYLLKEVAIPDNLRLILFLYGFGAFVGLVRVTGGVSGFARWMEERVRTVRGAFAVVWTSSLITFMAPDFRIITVAPVIKQVFERLKVPTNRVAFVIDLTATPLTAIVPIGTAFVGYMVALIASSNRQHAVAGTAYQVFLQSLPFNFFSWAMLIYGLYATFFSRTSPAPEKKQISNQIRMTAETRLRIAGEIGTTEVAKELTPSHRAIYEHEEFPDAVELVSESITPNLLNLALPLGLLLVLTLWLTWWDGHLRAATFWGALAAANAAKAMLEALIITLLVSFAWYAVQRQPISRTLFGFLAGGNEMLGVIVLLVLVWSVSSVSTDLGFITYTERTIGRLVPPAFIAPVLFVFGSAISYVIGSSFGTWGILLPLGFSLAMSTHASLPLIAGAVFASGTFGGFASPLSDNTVAMSTVMKLPLMGYARMKLKAALPVAAVCTLFYTVAGFVM